MALTIAIVDKQDFGDGQRIVADITYDSSYPTGGEALAAVDLGFRVGSRLDAVQANAPGGLVVSYLTSSAFGGNLLIFEQDAGGPLAEVASASDQSAVTARVTAYGR